MLSARTADKHPHIRAVERLVRGISRITPHARHHTRGRDDEQRVDLDHHGRQRFDQLVKRRDDQPLDLILMCFVKFLAVLQAVELQKVDPFCGKACE